LYAVLTELHEVRYLPIGQPSKVTHDNLVLTGNLAGAITPALGFGLHAAILSGLYAAESIVLGKDYNQLMSHHNKEYHWSLALRNAMEMLSQDQYDMIINGLDSAISKAVIRPNGLNLLRFGGATCIPSYARDQKVPLS
jgi:digeranylgeranylglycerophospholipid reductase